MDARWRQDQQDRAAVVTASLAADGVDGVALSYVDNAGVTRTKAVALGGLAHAAAWGVGMSPVFDVFLVDDSVTSGRLAGGPDGDLRLYPDLDRVVPLAAQPGWAWAPVDRYSQEGLEHPGCQRSFARRMAADAAAAGLDARMGFEVEWAVGSDEGQQFRPACQGPAYGMTRIVELSDYCRDILTALAAESVQVLQLHPEYAAGQFEVSAAPEDPVAAADQVLLVRETIRAVSRRHGLAASFAPAVVAGQVGNGQHLHLSAWAGGGNLFNGGPGPYGLTPAAENLLAELLDRLPALAAIGAPSVASYLRLVPQHWAAPYQCWGRENREAALRLVTGSVGERDVAANAELKCVDGSANPYLVVGAVAAIAAGVHDGNRSLPPETPIDPALLPAAEQPPRLPQSVEEAVAALRADPLLTTALGEPLLEAFCAVRLAEADLFRDADPATIAEASRWIY
jgi:glutamine synthetase